MLTCHDPMTQALGARAADRRRVLLTGLTGLAWLAASRGAAAQAARPAPEGAPDEPPVTAELIRTGLYRLAGVGGNAVLRLSARGSVLVDGMAPGHHRPLMRQVRRISRLSDLPTRLLIVTSHQAHHAGNAGAFRAAGVAVLVQRQGMARIAETSLAPASAARPLAPVIAFDEAYHLRLGGIELRALHVGAALTDNDTVVHFPDLRVAAVGDLLAPGVTGPDVTAGGRWVGWRDALDAVSRLDVDLIVPSVGPAVGRAELSAGRDRIDALLARAAALVREGLTPSELGARIAARPGGPSIAQVARLHEEASRFR